MKFSFNWLKDFVDIKIRPEKLAEFLNLRLAETLAEKHGKDYIFDISILPNRAHDALSHIGMAREISAIINSQFQIPNSKFQEDKKLKTKDYLDLKIENAKFCPRYIGRVIDNVKVGPSPKWLKGRIEAVGLRSINNIVDATNYVMLETGQPLHVFDFDKLEKNKGRVVIFVRNAKKGEKITTLDKEKYELDESVLMIADAQEPIAIAGIKGGKKAEIDVKTRRVVLEAANFDPVSIRRSSKKLNLGTDASLRFGQGISPELVKIAEERASALIQEIGGGKIFKGVKDFYPKKQAKVFVGLELDWLEKFLGVKIPESDVKKILKSLGFKLKPLNKNKILVEAPFWRVFDTKEPPDLAEEIGRVWGYEKIPETPARAALTLPKTNEFRDLENRIEKNLLGMGFSQVLTYSFHVFSADKLRELGENLADHLAVQNPTSPERTWLRDSLILNIVEAASRNLKNFDEVRLFEIGKIYKSNGEKTMLTGILASKKTSIQNNEFFELKGVASGLMESLGAEDVWYDDSSPTPYDSNASLWHPYRMAEIKIGPADKKSEKIREHKEEVGFLGEINPRILEKLDIKERVAVFDIDLEKLGKLIQKEFYFEPFSKYPAVRRDLSVLTPNNTRLEDVLYIIETAGGSLLFDLDVFDIYEGPELPEGKINFAFRLVFQSFEKTLTADEIDEKMKIIIKALEKNPEWEVRK
ncbi:MAG: phenylalanine--tRNA ligase subunit beta [Parcubacteria group bacterium]|nr:phenylalanine--tRNA ligase subunit beta [Parcubacteria group bacterium]